MKNYNIKKKIMKKFILAFAFGIICALCFGRANSNVGTYNETGEPYMFVINDSTVMYRNAYLIEVRAAEDVETKVVKIPTHYEFKKGARLDTIMSGYGCFTVPTNTYNTYVLYSSKPFNEAHFKNGNCSLF